MLRLQAAAAGWQPRSAGMQRRRGVPLYLVERELPGITIEQLLGVQHLIQTVSEQFTAAGKPVRCLRSTLLPAESRCLSLFEAAEAAIVRELYEAARLPFRRILEALDLPPQPAGVSRDL
jgi:hypothetical protein